MAHLKSVDLRGMPANGGGRVAADETLYIAKINGGYYLGTFERAQFNGDSLLYTTEGDCFWLDRGRQIYNWQKLWEFIDD